MVASKAPSPRPTPIKSDRKPAPMPSICGIVRRKPKFTPEANSIILFGPGVIEVAKAKVTSAVRVAVSKKTLPKKSAAR